MRLEVSETSQGEKKFNQGRAFSPLVRNRIGQRHDVTTSPPTSSSSATPGRGHTRPRHNPGQQVSRSGTRAQLQNYPAESRAMRHYSPARPRRQTDAEGAISRRQLL